MSNSYSGRVHDTKIAEYEKCTFPEAIRLYKDLGYQGYSPGNVINMAPIKKPKGEELNKLQKWYNSTISHIRVSVEHAIAGIKRCRIIKERCRISYERRGLFLIIATGLHNLRVFSPLRAYKTRLASKYR